MKYSVRHLYTRAHQPATRFLTVLHIGPWVRKAPDWGYHPDRELRVWTRYPGNRLIHTSCCRKRRPAKNLTVQAYYDMLPFWCRPGKGCRAWA